LGEGFGGPVIRADVLFLLDRVDDQQDVLRCIALDSGEERWSCAYESPGSVSFDGSRAAPTVTDAHVYAVGLMGQFYCVSRETHEIVWRKNLADAFPPVSQLKWGYAQSPALYKNLVLVAPQSEDAFVVAFDQASGEQVWATETLGEAGYSSPLVVTLDGIDQVVMISAGDSGGVTGISLDDGKVLWRYDNWHCSIPIPQATPIPDNRLFITGEYGAGSAMLRIQRQEDGSLGVEELWKSDECESQIHQPLLFENHLFLNSNGNKRNDGMACVTLEGKLLWRTRDGDELPRFERGGLLLSGDLILNMDGKTGILHLIAPSPEGYRELARAQIFEGEKMWAPLALSDGKLVLRSQEEMKCLDLRNP